MTILGHRLYRTVAVLGLRRIVVMAVVMSLVGGVTIVPVGMFVRNGKLWLLKKMMDTMGRGRREKKNKKGNDPQGADGAEITKCCSHSVDNYLYLVLFGQGILIKKPWPAQAQSAKLKLIIGWSETASWTVQAEATVSNSKPYQVRANRPLDSISSP